MNDLAFLSRQIQARRYCPGSGAREEKARENKSEKKAVNLSRSPKK